MFDQRPFVTELPMELVSQETGSGKGECSVFLNRGRGLGRAKAGTGVSDFSNRVSVLLALTRKPTF